MMKSYCSNKFRIASEMESAIDSIAANLSARNGEPVHVTKKEVFGWSESEMGEPEEQRIETLVGYDVTISGSGSLEYRDGRASESVLRMSGNLETLVGDLSRLTIDSTSVMLVVNENSDNGRVASHGYVGVNGTTHMIDVVGALHEFALSIGATDVTYDMTPLS